MRKSGKLVLLMLLAVILVAALVACNYGETGQNGGTPGDGGGDTPATAQPYGLTFDVLKGASAFDKAVIGDFDVTRDVVGYVLMKTGDNAPVRTGSGFAVSTDMIAAEELAKLNEPGTQVVEVSYNYDEDTVLTGKFTVNLMSPATQSAEVALSVGEGARVSGGGAKQSADDPSVWTVSLGLGASYSYDEFVSRFVLFAPSGQALSHYTYGDGQTFGAGDTLVVEEGMTLTAVYTSTYVNVVFDLNAPDNCWDEGGAPAAPETTQVALNGTVPRPASQNYKSPRYTLLGWSVDGTAANLWNFSVRLSSQTDVRGTLTLYAVWTEKSATASVRLSGGTFADSLDGIDGLTDTSGLKAAVPAVTYGENGKIDSFAVSGIAYGDTLSDYYAEFALTSGGTPVAVALADLPKLITKSAMYRCAGLWTDALYTENALTAKISSSSLTVCVEWDIIDGNVDDEYYNLTYNFVLKPDNTYMITAKDRTAEVLYIPGEYNGLPVTEIAASAFSGMSQVTKVDFSEASGLVKIGDSAFFACTSLAAVDGTDSLGALTTVGADAFYATAWINNRSAGEDAMLGGVLVKYGGGYGTAGAADLTDAPYVYIAANAFSGCNFSSVVLPAGVKGIDSNAFTGSTLEGGVTAAGTSIGYIGVDAFKGSLFVSNISSDIVIGNVFYRAANPAVVGSSVTVPASVTVIADQAFAGCTNISDITFESEETIVSVGRNAFRGTAYANGDEDGFVIVNGILAGYFGSASTVVVPDEVRTVGAYAFGSGVRNVVFRSTSQLESISDYAFAGASSLLRVAIYKNDLSLLTLGVAPYAFANAAGTGTASAGMGLYIASELRDQIAEKGGALAYLAAQSKVFDSSYAATSPVAINSDVFTRHYVASDDGSFGAEDFIAAWGASVVTDDETQTQTVIVSDGVSVTRDGITVNEDYPLTVEELEASLAAAQFSSAGQQEVYGSMTVSYGGNQLTYPYIIHAAIDEASFEMDDMYKFDSSRRLVFYNTQQEFDASGSMRFDYKQLSVGGKIGAAGLTSSVPLSSAGIAVTGYQSSVGEYNVADGQGLTVTYDYYGTTYTKAFDFVVKSPSIASLRQTSAAVLPLGVTASDYYSQITFDAVYDDGSTQSYDLDDATVVSVGGSAATTLDTSVAGVYTAVIEFRPATSSVPTQGTIVYAVELVPIYDLYTFEFTPYEGGAREGIAGEATITAASGNRSLYVLPSEATDDDGNVYTVTAIGANAFAGKSALTTVYLPSSVKEIGSGAFAECTSLADLLGFDYDTAAASQPSVDFSDVLITDEHREGEASVAILNVNDYALSEDVITFPYAVSYDGTITLDQLSESMRAHYTNDAVITATYTLSFSVSSDAADDIAARLGGYDGTVRIPANGGTVLPAFSELYTALSGVVTVELYEAEVLGIDALVSRIEIENAADVRPEYTSRTGSVTVVGKAAREGSVAYIPETLYGVWESGEDRTSVYTVTGLGAGVFADIRDITAVYVPQTVIELADGSLDGVFGGAGYSTLVYMYADTDSLIRPHTVGVSNEPFPVSVTTVGDRAFYNCAALTVNFSTAIDLISIGREAFYGCSALGALEFGTGAVLETIGFAAFSRSGVTTVNLGNTRVTDLGDGYIFEGCASLTTLVLPAAVTTIGANAFNNCFALANVSFTGDGNNIAVIGAFAFHNCAFDPSVVTARCTPDCSTAANAFDNCKPVV